MNKPKPSSAVRRMDDAGEVAIVAVPVYQDIAADAPGPPDRVKITLWRAEKMRTAVIAVLA